MITKQNIDYSQKYEKLFADAYELLGERSKLSTDDIARGKFTSLEEYFMHIGDLAEIHGEQITSTLQNANKAGWNESFARYSKYLMLPLDEEYFKINANTRTITVPSVYAVNGIGLAGDHRAETLLFEVDRYFDFIDLIRTNIYVQWTNPDDTPGASLISLIDYDDKKIRFGWTISDQVAVDGNKLLTFSIRFFMREGTDVKYSLNTLPVSVKVRPALRTTIEDNYTDEDPDEFVEAIVNGSNSNADVFAYPAIIYTDLPDEGYLDSTTNSYVFKVSAAPQDNGSLTYQWKFISVNQVPGADIVITDLADDEAKNIDISTGFEKTTDATRNSSKRYYTTEDGLAFELVEFADGAGFVEGIDYYEAFAYCSIGASDTHLDVAGQYYVRVVNTVSGNVAYKLSKKCTFPAPQSITYSTDLVEYGEGNILQYAYNQTTDDEKNADKTYYTCAENIYTQFTGEAFEDGVVYYERTDNKQKVLSINALPDDDHADLSYQWYKKTSADGTGAAISGATEATYTTTAPGWYYVTTTSTLNRAQITENSKVSKITNTTVAPTLTEATDTDGVVIINFGDGVADTRDITITATVAGDGSLDNALISEGLTYNWMRQIVDGEEAYEPVKVGEAGVISVSDGVLRIRYAESAVFKCEVSNTLNGKTAKAISKAYSVIKVV